MIKLNTINGQLVYENVNEQTSEKFRYLLQLFNEDGNSLQPQRLEERLRIHPIASRLTARNFNKSYIVPVDSGSVLINFLPRKTTVRNSNYDYKVNPNFETFEPLEFRNELPDPFTLDDGTLFRVTGGGVKKIDEYTYYVMDGGEMKQIPNWKTAQVLLNERGQLVESIRVIEPRQYNDLIRQSNINSLVQNGMAVEEAEQVAAEIQTGKNPTFPIPPSANVQAPPSFTGPNAGAGGNGGGGGTANYPFALPPSGPTPSAGGFGAPPAGAPSPPTGPGGVSSGGGGGAGGFASGPNGSSTSAGVPAGQSGAAGIPGGGSNGPGGGAGGSSGTIGGPNGWNPSDLSDPNNPSNPANQGGGEGPGGEGPGGGAGGGGASFPDLSSEYTDDMEMLSMSEAFMQLSDTTGGQCQTMQTFQDSVDQTFDTMNNELDAMEAEADAAKAEADAAKTQAEAAVASSNAASTSADAAIAQANAAKAEAEAAKEEAEALKAQLELELQQLQQQSQI